MEARHVLKRLVRILVCAVISLWGLYPAVQAETIDNIAAILDDQLILLSEVRESSQWPVIRVIANLENSQHLEQETLHYLIERQLLFQEIHYLPFPKDPEPVRALATQYLIAAYHQNDPQAFAEQLQTAQVTAEALDQELAVYIKGMDYMRRKHRFDAEIDKPEVVLNLFQQWVQDLRAQASLQTLF